MKWAWRRFMKRRPPACINCGAKTAFDCYALGGQRWTLYRCGKCPQTQWEAF